jgi:hypothetical protein
MIAIARAGRRPVRKTKVPAGNRAAIALFRSSAAAGKAITVRCGIYGGNRRSRPGGILPDEASLWAGSRWR